MTKIILMCIAWLLFQCSASSQYGHRSAVVASAAASAEAYAEAPDGKDEPAAKLYKQGYHLVLDEQWEEALQKLKEVITKYPASDYVDDAEYWMAYAEKHSNPKKARAAYEKFIQKHPGSKYVDDAVADLSELGGSSAVTVSGFGDSNMVLHRFPGGYAYGTGTTMHLAEDQMRRSERQLRRQLEHLGRPVAPLALPPRLFMPGVPRPDENLDDETKLKMKALYALGETKEDEKAFSALRDVALDMNEARPLREAALDALTQFKKFDILPVFLEIVKRDTSEDLENTAIDYIGQHGKDKAKSVQTLIDLYRVLPEERVRQKRAIFYSIADLGNDRAVDFLASVAKANEDYELRTEAIYYLGSIGGEKARAALYDIMRGKKEK